MIEKHYEAHFQGKRNAMTANMAKKTGSFSSFYIAFWCVAGVAGLAYVAAMAINPLATQHTAAVTTDLDQKVAEAKETSSRNSSDLSVVRKDVAALRTDIEAVRTQTATREDRERQMLARLTAVEERIAVSPARTVEPPAVAPASQATPKAVDPKLDPRRLKQRVSELTTGTVPAAPEAPVAPVLPPNPALPQQPVLAPTITAEPPLALTPPAPKPPVAAVKPQTYAVRLASGTSLDELRLSWNAINESGRDVLGPLQPRYQKVAGQAPYQLIAGPFKSEAEAGQACLSLAQKGLACAPTTFKGQGL